MGKRVMVGKRKSAGGYGGRGMAKRQRKLAPPTRTNLLKAVKSLSEDKFVDISPTFTLDFATPYHINLLNGIATGSDLYQRVGRSVFMKQLNIDFQFQNINTGSSTPDLEMRVLVVLDKAPNGAALPVLADFLREINAAGAATTNLNSMQNTNNRERFKFLFDKKIGIPPWNVGATTTGAPALNMADCYWRKKIKLPKKMQFSGTGSAVSDIQTNALYVVMAHDQAAVIAAPWQLKIQARVDFYDI